MNSNGMLQKHWLNVSFHFILDASLFFLAFLAAAQLRLGTDVYDKLNVLWPGMLLGALFFSCITYICGMYSPLSTHNNPTRRTLILGLCLGLTIGFMMGIFYIKYSTRIGRGIMLIG